MGLRKEHHRHSKRITRGPRWKALRMQALNRDGWMCVKCGSIRHLEIDHIKPVRTHPNLAYSLCNLQTLCAPCHTRKTRIEVGHEPLPPKRQAWRDLLRQMQRNPSEQQEN